MLRHSQTKSESLSSKMLMLRDNYSLVMCIIYAEIDIVILSDALFLHLLVLVVRDIFNIPRTEMERRPNVLYPCTSLATLELTFTRCTWLR